MEAIVAGSFTVLLLVAVILHRMTKNSAQQMQLVANKTFLTFQHNFFVVYFLALFGDWLQGPYVYKLYNFYGFDEAKIALLYVAGFGSSVIFGTATGPLADLVGRRKIAILYCITYSFCCLTKISSNFWVLLVGRLFGGIATSMLFSTFEAWYVYEHTDHYGFPAEWISVTFAATTFSNGLLAIIAGVMANFTAETLGYGPVAPFMLAVLPLILCGLIVCRSWSENYGSRKHPLFTSCAEGLYQIMRSKKILQLGLIQTVVESGMYIFVFLWTPVLLPASPPLGLVFSCFMVAIMIGSTVYNLLLSRGFTAQQTLRISMVMIAVAMGICTFITGPHRTEPHIISSYMTFLLLEVAFGMYFPAMSFVKSQVIPESHRANVMNWFRVPMNLITCAALLCMHIEVVSNDTRTLFAACFAFSLFGIFVSNEFIHSCKEELNAIHNAKTEEKQPLSPE